MRAKLIERMVADLRTQSLRRDTEHGDGQLMDAFIVHRDQAAFAALVERHGPMVLGVCRRILGHVQDSEDAFQAVFWVLARKAHAVRPRIQVGNWLYGVAVRTAQKARGLRVRRRELQVNAMPPQTAVADERLFDLSALLDQEIERLPSKYRGAVVLCELEGRSRAEAAAQLRIPEGTLSSRLAYARKLLARQLRGRGIVLSAAGLGLAGAAVPPPLLASALRAATEAAPTSASVSHLLKGVLTAMFLNKLKHITTLALGCVVVLGLGVASRPLWGNANADEPAGENPIAQNRKQQAPKPAEPQSNPANVVAPDSFLGLWRVVRIDSRPTMAGGMGEEGGGGSAPGPMGAAGAMAPGGIMLRGGPMGAAGMGLPGMGMGFGSTVYDGANGKAFLSVAKDQATFSSRALNIVYRTKISPSATDMRTGAIDMTEDAGDESVTLLGRYVLDGSQLELQFGPAQRTRKKGPTDPGKPWRPKDAKEATETWTLVRPPTRQQIYQRLDQLQGEWTAVSGAYNGEALLPRELKSVELSIRDAHWHMTPPTQPAQPDAVPRRFFSKPLEFVLDLEGPRSYLVLQNVAKSGEVRVLYEVRGDELKVCWSTRWPEQRGVGPMGSGAGVEAAAEAPRDFKTTPGSDLVLFVLKRPRMQNDPNVPGAPTGVMATPPGVDAGIPPEKTTADAKLAVRVIAVGDLISREPGKEGSNLIQVITRTVEPNSWDNNGGAGSIEYFPEGKSLVIQQTSEVHSRIEAVLIEMRQAKKQQEKD